MKKFVICTNRCGLVLTDDHVAWLHTNGHPEADHYVGDKDRSNPDLIACIEAVRATKQPMLDEGNRLWDIACEIKANNAHINALLSAEIDKTLELLDYRRYMKGRIIAEMRKVIKSGNWMDATIYAEPKAGVTESELRCQFGAVVDCFSLHRAEFQAEIDAFVAYHEYCHDHNLNQHNGQFVIDDGFEIKSYDETRFVATVGISYGDGRFEDDREFLHLKPFLTHSTLASFVDAGDTDGLMDYLKSLNIGGLMDIRDDRPRPAVNDSEASMTDEEFTKLLADFGILEGKAY